ncbi:MAG: 30S ribosome-binding factor RbfA [Bacilli bacterium]|nr:30S ribosome-binding factor RbfA [Bacilli bacterium]MBO6195547.1 30S ribosome-binding factor RbfA [Bacilli bacterium]
MSIKTERLAHVLAKEISQILMLEVKDEDIKFVTITHVDLSSDLSYAKVYCTVLDDNKRDKCIHDLNGAKGFIRSELIKRKIEMRKIPELSFIFDESIEYGNKIEKIIENIHKED